MENMEENSEKIGKIQQKLLKDMEYGRKASWIVKWYGKYGRKVSEMWNDMEKREQRQVEMWNDMENMEQRQVE